MLSISANTDKDEAEGGYDIGLDDNFNLALVYDKTCVRQDTMLATQMLRGEYPYDTQRGVPYMEFAFRDKNIPALQGALREEIASVPNVVNVTALRLLDINNVLAFEAEIQTSYGPVNL